MKTVAVCGDSWFTSDTNFPGASMGEILARTHSWNLLSLARGGCSNFAIALQVEKAIELKADIVVLGTTTPDRIELPIIQESNLSIWDKLKKSFTWEGWVFNQPTMYIKRRGLSNIQYHPHPDLSSQHSFLTSPTVISESMNNLAFDSYNSDYYTLTDDQKTALKSYMVNLYDSGLKRQTDAWIISNACRKLEHAGIPFLIYTHSLYQRDYLTDIDWLSEDSRSDLAYSETLPMNPNTRFHYCPEKGGTIFANHTTSKLQLLKGIL